MFFFIKHLINNTANCCNNGGVFSFSSFFLHINSLYPKKTHTHTHLSRLHQVVCCYPIHQTDILCSVQGILGSYAGIVKGNPTGQMSGTGQYNIIIQLFFFSLFLNKNIIYINRHFLKAIIIVHFMSSIHRTIARINSSIFLLILIDSTTGFSLGYYFLISLVTKLLLSFK